MNYIDRKYNTFTTEERVDRGELLGVSPILTVVAATPVKMTYTTAAGCATHALISFLATGAGQVDVYSGATGISGGVAQTFRNFNFLSSRTAGGVVTTGVTTVSDGTKVADFLFPGGNGGNSIGGNAAFATKVVLPASTTFLFVFTAETGTIKVEPSFVIYEQPR